MKIFITIMLVISMAVGSQAQKKSSTYFTGGSEIIFGFATIDNDGVKGGNIMRFTGWFHLQGNINHDFNKTVGIYTGLGLRNVGFIYNDKSTGLKKKYRNYTVGIPFGFKLGSMNKMLMFAGYEIEFPINYKEKTFENDRKDDVFNEWFSKRVPTIYNTVFFGVQFKYGISLKFKYYLDNFFKQSFTEVNTNGVELKPYENIDVRMFYFSISFNLFKGSHFVYSSDDYMKKM